ncbi:glycoprotein-N-acetylgalactosamine 3-beta-galactosyltransferase 1-B-like [Haliotis rubra]|uniref:glycoprotein-N-acetylgalactosamine 3-beta-galactosyltransferase 1-B-like n=1 Tax=Haliotis rubra TaxID=36100 RepID=UPI001EE57121|nr:glycoprotein-N-acetylgalactosamine 3-beta-galactosyltransferase 1-B-like [Haliotis rubra]XP_046555614.1 glycoprotein-N-acetylgalactosamine 3-beta-galactosyltransferase 1-B-like [Haliotis rubra]XP_046555615.1 glycoprotein-N-acetylgalactosamine 3-beta-galactosyltransferase 1-B-like [Haliotis rubra]XP_046555616.1 glycoprotein-N-acetylgalactosamine 3-beta-galactosyltransferase 1-B-like [Haliotis rubra]XP_046555617.1 glycoprotein-N-acetylgalactosamine 3-beta-galactosyltransferase 1-B-like [Haliot
MALRLSGLAQVQLWIGITIGLVVAFLVTSISRVSPITSFGFSSEQLNPRHIGQTVNTMTAGTAGVPASGPKGENLHEEFEKHVEKHKAGNVKFEDKHVHHDDDTIAKSLFEKERVLCWIMTSPQNLESKARVVRDTWAKRCNKVIFISSTTDPKFPTVGLKVAEGREHLTAKTIQAFRYIYEKHIDDADWFMKADDDTYVILENLRYFLSSQKKTDPVYFGHHFKTIVKQGYYSGGGGYVLSKEALKRYGEKGHDPKICRQDGGAEDAEFGKCMENLGVKTVNSTDALGRSRFHCFDPETHLFGGYPDWYYQYDANGAQKGTESISDYAISFHYVPPQKMYALEFYIYHLRPYGIVSGTQDLNKKHVKPGTQAH